MYTAVSPLDVDYFPSTKYTPIPVREKEQGDVKILTPVGPISAENGLSDLDKGIKKAFESGKGLVINMEHVPAIDRDTVGTLVTAHQSFGGTAERGAGSMSIANMDERIVKKLAVARLDRVLNRWSDEATAVANTPARLQSGPTVPAGPVASAVAPQPHA